MKMPAEINCEMISPCGVNCFVCDAYLDRNNPCPGCRSLDERSKRKICTNCKKKRCADARGINWCLECTKFPCLTIKSMSWLYKQSYGIDLVKNGLDASKNIDEYMAGQREKFTCDYCGGVVDMQNKICSDCGRKSSKF